ncbi:hypothetical protein RB594_004500 [Gaeumannomyces avenae]
MDFTEQPGGLPPSLLAAGFGPDDFDYGAFLESAHDADYLAEESSASNRSSGGDGSEPLPAVPLGASPSSSQVAISSYSAAVAAVAQVPLGDSSSSGDSSRSPPPPKQRLERRGHTKSRRGCFNCKRRRIKCQENRPACGHCVKTGLKCEYPAAPLVVVHRPRHQAPVFTLQDMRLFQHFLLRCYPHQPLNNDAVWTHEVPCLSQEHDYLMHAVLGLAASDLAQDDPSLYEAAMSHRLKAIKAVKKALADSPRRARQQRQQQQQQQQANSSSSGGGGGGGGGSFTSDEGNALLATCYALTFQSVLLDDGMAEYMTFIRGIIIVMIQMYTSGARFLFSNFVGDEQDAILKPLMDRVPMIDRRRAEAAAAAVAGLEPLVAAAAALSGSSGGGDDDGGDAATAAAYHAHLTAMAAQMRASPYGAYKAVAAHYGWWMQLPHARFRALVDDGDDNNNNNNKNNNNKNNNKHLFALLASHWVAVKMVLRPVTEVEMRVSAAKQQVQQQQRQQRRGGGVEGGMARWLRHLNAQVPSEYAAYNRWPVWVQEQMARDPGFFGTAGGGGSGGE